MAARDTLTINDVLKQTNVDPYCALCGAFDNLMTCAACRLAWYCCKDHQKSHWKHHKPVCKEKRSRDLGDPRQIYTEFNSTRGVPGPSDSTCFTLHGNDRKSATMSKYSDKIQVSVGEGVPVMKSDSQGAEKCSAMLLTQLNNETKNTSTDAREARVLSRVPKSREGSSEAWILNSASNQLNPTVFEHERASDALGQQSKRHDHGRSKRENGERLVTLVENASLVNYVASNMLKNGVCVVDKFLGDDRGGRVLEEVKLLHSSGVFKDGQLVSQTPNSEKIRGDKITWVDGSEDNCSNILYLISVMDAIVKQLNQHIDPYCINGRTKVRRHI